jgi:hypothetical protein
MEENLAQADDPRIVGKDMVFLAHALLGPNDRSMMIAGEGFHPALVVDGALASLLTTGTPSTCRKKYTTARAATGALR